MQLAGLPILPALHSPDGGQDREASQLHQSPSVLPWVPTCSPECDPSLERQRDVETMRIRRFSQC